MLNGVSAARRKRLNPAEVTTSRMRASPACAPRHSPTSCDREHGVHSGAENEYITRPTGFIFLRLEPFTSQFFNQAGRSHDRFQTGFRNI